MGTNWKSWNSSLWYNFKLWISSDVQYGTPGNGLSIPILLNNIANPNLTWETTEQLNFGLDFSVLDERISGTIDLYDKTTKDLLQNIPIPNSTDTVIF